MKTIKNKIVYEKNINELPAKALAIVFPENIQELKNLVKLIKEDLVPRGSGTSFTGACIPKNSIIVDFSKMNKIIEINSENKTVAVEPGVLLHELNEELEAFGLEFPIEPLFGGIETIGGMMAKNSAGNREIKYSRMINWVDSIEIIDGKGEQIKISKSDLSDFVGMEGTTGFIIRAILRLTNRKQRSITILKANTLSDVFIANRKLRLKQDISSIDLINPEISSFLGLEKKYHLFIELDSLEGAFKSENYEKFIKLKNKAYKKAATEGFCYMSNVKFLIDSLQDFLIYLDEQKIPYFSHMASGTVFCLFKIEEMQKMQEVMKFAKRLRGKIAYNFGIGLTKKDSLEPGELAIIQRVKARRDPEWKFNKDKLIDYKLSNGPEKNQKEKTEDTEEEEKNLKKEAEILKEQREQIKQVQKQEEQKNEEKESQEGNQAQQLINSSETTTIKRPEPELSPEEKDKIKKIAGGFFGGKTEKNN